MLDAKISQIEQTIKNQLARYKHPKKFIVIDELPRNTMGKVQKNYHVKNIKIYSHYEF